MIKMGRKKEKGFWDSLGSSVDNVFSSVGELASDAFDEANKFAKKTQTMLLIFWMPQV